MFYVYKCNWFPTRKKIGVWIVRFPRFLRFPRFPRNKLVSRTRVVRFLRFLIFVRFVPFLGISNLFLYVLYEKARGKHMVSRNNVRFARFEKLF